jgi:hypothetical protein
MPKITTQIVIKHKGLQIMDVYYKTPNHIISITYPNQNRNVKALTTENDTDIFSRINNQFEQITDWRE